MQDEEMTLLQPQSPDRANGLKFEVGADDTVTPPKKDEAIRDIEFPLNSFPQKIKNLVKRMVRTENFLLEFIFSAIISVVAAAIGNAFHIRIKGHWVNNPAMFIMLAGRPGVGKTPPMEAAYRPLRKLDQQRLQQHIEDLEVYEESRRNLKSKDESEHSETLPKPTLTQSLLNDFTTESMLQTHEFNKRGIAIVVDEIMGMFNSSGKYGKSGNQIETFLSAFSGSPLKVSRKSSPLPFVINHPCISIIGTIQVERFKEIFAKGLNKSGLLDRFLVVFPKEQKIPLWDPDREGMQATNEEIDSFAEWENIMERIFSIETKIDDLGDVVPTILDFSDEARNVLFKWRNLNVIQLSENSESPEVESREMKRAQIVSKMALTLQVLKWACGEGSLNHVDHESVQGAIALSEYYEDCYYRLLNVIDRCSDRNTILLSQLPEVFTTQEALKVGEEFNLRERSVLKLLHKLVETNRIRRLKRGYYSQVIGESYC